MKKMRRSSRMVDMTQFLLERPRQLIPLTFFSERYGSAKSSISEDLQIIRDVLMSEGTGALTTIPGAAGGVKYIPQLSLDEAYQWAEQIMEGLNDPGRILPGGYLYMSDYLHQPQYVNKIGKVFSSLFSETAVDYVMTVETKGIPLAYSTAQYLNAPLVIARRDTQVMEGSVVSINYISGSSKRIQTMSLSRRSIKEGANVLVVDDFMKAGGTVRGMIDLLQEFQARVVGTCVFVESESVPQRLVDKVTSFIRLGEMNGAANGIELRAGNIFETLEEGTNDE